MLALNSPVVKVFIEVVSFDKVFPKVCCLVVARTLDNLTCSPAHDEISSRGLAVQVSKRYLMGCRGYRLETVYRRVRLSPSIVDR